MAICVEASRSRAPKAPASLWASRAAATSRPSRANGTHSTARFGRIGLADLLAEAQRLGARGRLARKDLRRLALRARRARHCARARRRCAAERTARRRAPASRPGAAASSRFSTSPSTRGSNSPAARSSSETRLIRCTFSSRSLPCWGSATRGGAASAATARRSASRSTGLGRKSRAPARSTAPRSAGSGLADSASSAAFGKRACSRASAAATSAPSCVGIRNHDVGLAFAGGELDRARLAVGGADRVARLGEQALDEAAEIQLVVDRQYPRLWRQGLSSGRGGRGPSLVQLSL